MTNYFPDGWVIVKITPENTSIKPHYRVFGSWGGGYLHGDSWRMNSGIERCVYRDGYYAFEGTSGSIYACAKDGYGRISLYNSGVLDDYRNKSQGQLEVLDDQDWTTVEWDK